MSIETQKSDVEIQDEKKTANDLVAPMDYLQTFPNAPSKATIEAWKQQAPNGVIRILALGKRVYLVRGVSGMELQSIQAEIPENLGAGLNPEARAAKIEGEVSLRVGSRCVPWTSTTPDNRLTVEQLRASSAGLPSTLFALISYLSDFIDPEKLELISAEL